MKGKRLTIRNPEEIEVRLKDEKDENVRIKLIFLNLVSNPKVNLEKICEIFAIATSTGYLGIRLLNFGVEFSEDQVARILRQRLKMHFSKPYPMDYRRPEDADRALENQLQLVLSLLKDKGLKEEDIAIGFIDEASPQNTANTVRVWSFEKVKSIKNSTRFKTNTIGFYAINGESIEGFLENSKVESIVSIYFVYLPRYSPDLNPIEQIWRSIERVLSLVFIENLNEKAHRRCLE